MEETKQFPLTQEKKGYNATDVMEQESHYD